MIPANKNPLVDSFFYVYLRWLFHSNFSGLYAKGIEHISQLDQARPVICFANHTNWWDGLMTYYLTRFNRHKQGFCMMEEQRLKHYRFFTWLGAFSIDTTNPLRAAASVRYAIHLLQNPETLCWIFPQGKIASIYEPIEVKEGTAYLANHSPRVQLLPIIFRYEFFREDRPTILIQIGKPAEGPRPFTDQTIRELLENEQVSLEKAIKSQNLKEFKPIIPPRLSVNKRWEWLKLAFQGKLREFKSEN